MNEAARLGYSIGLTKKAYPLETLRVARALQALTTKVAPKAVASTVKVVPKAVASGGTAGKVLTTSGGRGIPGAATKGVGAAIPAAAAAEFPGIIASMGNVARRGLGLFDPALARNLRLSDRGLGAGLLGGGLGAAAYYREGEEPDPYEALAHGYIPRQFA